MAEGPVLIVEDSESVALSCRLQLERLGYQVTVTETGAAALAALRARPFACMLLDLKLPDMDGMEILREVKSWPASPAIVVTTANAALGMAVEAVRLGAYDYLVKPFGPARLATTVSNAMLTAQLTREVQIFRQTVEPAGFEGFVGRSLAMQRVYRTIEAAARSTASVFITGESGTGKELAAQALHRLSPRAAKACVALNCGAIPRELMESTVFGHIKGAFSGAVADQEGAAARADGGTLFLDELGEMELALQTKLLRFIQTGAYERVGEGRVRRADIRFIAATNRDPLAAVREGRLREDLFYRLFVVPLEMPPLRARGDDILLIARHVVAELAAREGRGFTGLSADAEAALLGYDWPGNVRQLRNVLHNAVVLHDGPVLTAAMLPPLDPAPSAAAPVPAAMPAPESGEIMPLAAIERAYVERAIALCDGNIQLAARRLGISASTIYRKREGWAHA
jgi:DNA-binding NtrC family response regulator